MIGSNSILLTLLSLETVASGRYRSIAHDSNPTGRAFGGQLMAQALIAAGKLISSGRRLSTMQALFLHGAKVSEPVEYVVEVLQDGRRLSSVHVRALQGQTICLDAQFSFLAELTGLTHGTEALVPTSDPGVSPRPVDMSSGWRTSVAAAGYPVETKSWLDLRLECSQPEAERLTLESKLQYWMRVKDSLPDTQRIQEAALVYISDSWINFPCLAQHIADRTVGQNRYGVFSLNHGLWIYSPSSLDMNTWMSIDTQSPIARNGRSWAQASYRDEAGTLLALATQECMLVPQ